MYDCNGAGHCKGRICGAASVCKRLLDPEMGSFPGEGVRGLNPKAIVGVSCVEEEQEA